eukprot:Tbor_TRINITY_DN2716_c0_g1::TRINITY_DN2716_c0_g1_i1::g.15191::m.15191
MFDYRVSWMGKDHTTSALIRMDPNDMHTIPAGKQNQIYSHRREVERMVRQRLRLIKRDIDGGLSSENSDNDYDDGDVAVMKLTNFIKAQRLREGKLYVSYVDGSSHEGLSAVRAYNHYTHNALLSLCDTIVREDEDALIPTLPPESEFEAEFAEIEKLKRVEAEIMNEHRSEHHLEQEIKNDGLNEDRVNKDIATINSDHRIMKIRASIDEKRLAYNSKAIQYAKHVMSFDFVQGAKLSDGFHPETAVNIPLLIEARTDSNSPYASNGREASHREKQSINIEY